MCYLRGGQLFGLEVHLGSLGEQLQVGSVCSPLPRPARKCSPKLPKVALSWGPVLWCHCLVIPWRDWPGTPWPGCTQSNRWDGATAGWGAASRSRMSRGLGPGLTPGLGVGSRGGDNTGGGMSQGHMHCPHVPVAGVDSMGRGIRGADCSSTPGPWLWPPPKSQGATTL